MWRFLLLTPTPNTLKHFCNQQRRKRGPASWVQWPPQSWLPRRLRHSGLGSEVGLGRAAILKISVF